MEGHGEASTEWKEELANRSIGGLRNFLIVRASSKAGLQKRSMSYIPFAVAGLAIRLCGLGSLPSSTDFEARLRGWR